MEKRFEKHNEEVKRVWEAYRARRPERVPVVYGINVRFILLNEELNPGGLTFRKYSDDPRVMLEKQLEFHRWVRFNVPQDMEMGLPAAWDVYVDFQNYYEAGFLGASVRFPAGNVPAAAPLLADDNKRMLLDAGLPDLDESPLWRKNLRFYEHFAAKKREGYTFEGRPLGNIQLKGLGTDGPMTLFMSLRGQGALLDMKLEPRYFHLMMQYFTAFQIQMMKKARRIAGQAERQEVFGFADDSVELLGAADYREFVLPYHRQLVAELGGKGPHSIHLCGDVQRLLPIIRDELNVRSFDTGFPVRWEALRDALGEDVEVYGGVHVDTLRRGTPEDVKAEAKRILESGIMRGGRFVLREANNLAPLTPVENLQAMYEAAKEYGRY